MRICFIYRDPNEGGTSIEEIFFGLEKKIGKLAEISRFTYSKKKSFLLNARSLFSMKADIYHITGGVYFWAYFLWRLPVVLTIHDIGRFKELSGLRKWLYRILLLKGPMKFADAITTVSEFTKSDISTYFGNTIGNKVTVIYNPIPDQFSKSLKLFNQKHPRVLQVGTGHNKNLITVIKAVTGMDMTLVIIGRLNKLELLLLNECKIKFENYCNLEYHEVYRQYCLSDLVVFVSTHEGFGMPILEAQVTGRPVIASRATSIPEIGGDAVHYIDNPHSIEEIRAGIQKIICDNHYRSDLIESGFKNADRFLASSITSDYFKVYSSIQSR